jgi:hypothetical protein
MKFTEAGMQLELSEVQAKNAPSSIKQILLPGQNWTVRREPTQAKELLRRISSSDGQIGVI